MPTHVAIEIAPDSLLLAAAEEEGDQPRATAGKKVALPAKAGAAEIAAAARSALPGVRWNRAKLTVVVGDDATQLRRLDLPPAPADELTAMVRLLSAKELNAAEEDTADYLPVHSDAHGNTVIAACLAADKLVVAREIAKTLDAALHRVVLRPCAAATLLRGLAKEETSGPCLVVAPARGGADLVAFRDDKPVLIRSTRGETAAALQRDIRRTLPAASQALGEQPTAIVVAGAPAERTEQPTPSGPLPMRVVDLAEAATTRDAIRSLPADAWGPLTGVLGAALAAAGGWPALIDFLNPRQPGGEAPNRRRQWLLAAAAAAAVLAGVAAAFGRLAAMDREIADLRAAAERHDTAAESFADYELQVAAIDRWSATDVNWLDEIETLGRRLRPKPLAAKDYPAEEDAHLTELFLRPSTKGAGGQIDLKAVARRDAVPGDLEQRLRDASHSIQPISVTERTASSGYPFSFQTLIQVAPSSTEGEP